MNEIELLLISDQIWEEQFNIPSFVNITYFSDEIELKREFDITIIDKTVSLDEINQFFNFVKAYTLFYTNRVLVDTDFEYLLKCKLGKEIENSQIQPFFDESIKNFFSKPYGDKRTNSEIGIAQNYSGSVKWKGNYSVELSGDFGDDFQQISFWRYNVYSQFDSCLDFWIEYSKSDNVSLKLIVYKIVQGSVSDVSETIVFNENQISDVIRIDNQTNDGLLFFSLHAKGKGDLNVIALHSRVSRRGVGEFLPGGERFVTSEREELFCYFNPGDLKPPLNVYFSGYKTQEGFEGYYLMRKMKAPFLLVSEPRLEGGAFYIGSEEYETLIINQINKYMDQLNFSSKQVIFSGLSMGTFGALYYGCNIKPHAVLLGKPLASLGTMAMLERLNRPGGFPTSLDLLLVNEGSMSSEAVDHLNHKFWDKFDQSDFSNTKFIVSYMYEDDYDSNAYMEMISHLKSNGVEVFGKGVHGRHNDNTSAIVNWFSSQFKKVLITDFKRKID